MTAAILASCQVDSVVAITVDEGGSGQVVVTVHLDADAAQSLGDPATAIHLEDLSAAGWVVEKPRSDSAVQDAGGPNAAGPNAAGRDAGGVSLVVRRKFGSPNELAQVLGEIGGNPGDPNSTAVFSDVQLKLTDGFASTKYEFLSDLNLSGSLEQFSDPALTAALGGLALARTPEELQAEGLTAAQAATLKVSVRLPGELEQTTGKDAENTAFWEFPMSGGTASSATLSAQSSDTQPMPMRLLTAAGVLLVLAGIFLTVGLVRRRR